MRYMLDTDICIHLIRKKPQSIIERLVAHPVGEVGISSITLAELEYGVCKSKSPEKNREALSGLLAPLEIAAFDDLAAFCYGGVRASLERRGMVMGAMDMLIAAHAFSISAVLVTGNKREFGRIEGLMLEDWV